MLEARGLIQARERSGYYVVAGLKEFPPDTLVKTQIVDLNTYRITGSAHGNGDMYLTGTTNRLESDYTGTNYLYAYGLTVSEYVYLHSVSIGHAYVNAPENGLMDIGIDRAGNVYYKGNPSTIHLTKNGKGNLIQE